MIRKIITANKTPTETVDINREKKSKNRILRSISDEERCTKEYTKHSIVQRIKNINKKVILSFVSIYELRKLLITEVGFSVNLSDVN